MNTISLTVDAQGVALVTIDCPGLPVNVATHEFNLQMRAVIEQIQQDPAIIGAVITSGKDGFMAGADLKMLEAAIDTAIAGGPTAAPHFDTENRYMRSMETGGKPFAAAIHGAALSGGLELCLACHYRVISDDPASIVGLPEVRLGLLPAGGGTQRLPRLIGIEAALPLLLDGNPVPAARALEMGIVDAVAPRAELTEHARRWVLANRNAIQPWDRKGWQLPGGAGALAAHASRSFYVGTAQVRSRTQDNYPAPLAILSAVYEGTQLPLDRGMAVEARYFAKLASGPVARNLIRTQFINRKRYERLVHRPAGVAASRVTRVGVLGAGMMGIGIAYSAANAGVPVVLLDASPEQAGAGKAKAVDIARRAGGEEAAMRCESAIFATAHYGDLRDCDFVIEAVFETRAIKSEVLGRVCEVLGDDAILASNTSTLPITGLADCSDRPARFIGMHFFSPVERMPLLEIILGAKTSQETLARAMDLARLLRKIPIIVNDSPGFFTSRIFCTYVDEAMAMLAEGISPAVIENAARMAGMAASPLAVLDEVSLDLQQRVVDQADDDGLDERFLRNHARPVIGRMNALGRVGRKRGAGFYDYPAGGRKRLWAGLSELFPLARTQADIETVKQRLLYIQALESVRCLDEGVITAPADADIGAVLGLGFPAWTGGPLSLIETVGLDAFLLDCDRLAAAYGTRFAAPESLRNRQRFYSSEAS
ncbi:3-hydroxyacyl-CoA dehydrogenase NAD-binding domain-containing protein [Cupriavidus sp. AcVe19-1a]|uniref:3-hydroxyacyl-CoA dehydrogenase NAD-binding domain-containing protein n=1 Tax=Cupriavidus sp. AcVe19-1a TaxID=2821359 RepID=UPI001AE16969|nr:3-hydroxyacyl-CoA dehydrogenase NAD-binding domain-containing protein [Cupriavidus sp. AcVe19-1a]MBP0630539.1 enoyl-CoA hydratase/isomerase family protein [Cupriavidus sp. AcVe19-1a]